MKNNEHGIVIETVIRLKTVVQPTDEPSCMSNMVL